jgi:transposase
MIPGMARTSMPVELSASDREQLQQWASAHGTPQQVALRCRLVLAAATGQSDLAIASTQGVNRHSAALWRGRVRTAGIQTVWEIQAGRGRKPEYDQAQRDALIAATLQTKPKGMTHWSCRTMAKAQGVSKNTVNRLWQLHNLKPHLGRTFKLSRDPKFVEKLTDVVGLYRKRPAGRMGGMAPAVPEPVQGAGFQQRGNRVGTSECFIPGNRLSTSRTYSHGSIPRRRQLTITE